MCTALAVQKENLQFILKPTALESYSIFLLSADVETSRFEADITGEKANTILAVPIYTGFTESFSMCSYGSGPAFSLIGIFTQGAIGSFQL